MLTVGIEKKLADWPVDLTGAALLSLLLMVVALFARWLQTRLVGRRRSPASPVNREKTAERRWAG